MPAQKYLAYTYLIGWSKLDLWYYGLRYENIRLKRTPEEDLWIHYPTSGKLIPETKNKYGKPDVIHIDKTFDSIDEAIDYEYKVLQEHNVRNSPHC